MTAVPLAARLSPLAIARASGSNFLISFAFLSPGRRRALLAVYAFCRVVDDAVDRVLEAEGVLEAEATRAARATAEHELRFWELELDRAFAGEPQTPLGYALNRAMEKFGIQKAPLSEVSKGVRMDLEDRVFEDFHALEAYMSKVASAVGIACLPVFGADPERCTPYATKLGHALQYTNILRDLAEDGDLGRCYLPQDVLREHEISASELRSRPGDPSLQDAPSLATMLEQEHERAESLYIEASALLAELPKGDRRALRPARIMGRIYHELLRRVRHLGPELLAVKRVRVPMSRKIFLALFGLT